MKSAEQYITVSMRFVARIKYPGWNSSVMTDDKALEFIKGMKGVMDAFYLEGDILEKVKAEEATVIGAGNVPVINEGVNQAVMRDHTICIIKDPRFRPPPEPTVVLRSTDGKLMGVEVFPETSKQYMERDDVIWLSDGFIMFTDVTPGPGEDEKFIMPPIPFPELNESNGCKDVISCSPSPTSDAMIREWRKFDPSGKYASILVAYNDL